MPIYSDSVICNTKQPLIFSFLDIYRNDNISIFASKFYSVTNNIMELVKRHKLEEMEDIYNKCVSCAKKCKGYKLMFSIYYWASEYFHKFGDIDKSLEYSKLSLINAEKYYHKYFPNGEKYYSKRLGDLLGYIKDDNKKDWKIFNKKYKSIIGKKWKTKKK